MLIEREDRTSQLGVLGVDGSLRILTSLGWRGTGRAVFSPDSRYLAYDAAVPDETRHEQIRIIATDASRETVASRMEVRTRSWRVVGRRSTSALCERSKRRARALGAARAR